MERGNTKEQILEVALDLFSVQGYEATSIAQIADSVPDPGRDSAGERSGDYGGAEETQSL